MANKFGIIDMVSSMLNFADFALTIIGFSLDIGGFGSSRLLLDPSSSEERNRLQTARIFLRVLDLDMNQGHDIEVVGNIQASDNTTNEAPELSERVTNMIDRLPEQSAGVVRLYVEQDCDEEKRYLEHLRPILGHVFPNDYCSPSSRGFEAAASQWSSRGPALWCTAWSHGLGTPASPEMPHTSDQGVPRLLGFRNSRNTSFGRIGIARMLYSSMMRNLRQTRVLNNPQGQVVMLISCKTFGPGRTAKARNVGGLVDVLSQLWPHYASLTNGNSQVLQKKLLFLWFHHAHLLELSSLIEEMRNKYIKDRQGLFNSRTSSLEMSLMEEMTYDMGIYQDLESSVKNLKILIESLSASIEATFHRQEKNDGRDYSMDEFQELIADISGTCMDALSKTTDVSSSMEHQLKFLDLRRELKQSNSLWILSVLASIFLPLSLASAILSMSTRFNDLGPLLYDFCGVTILLMTLVLLILLAIRQLMKFTEAISRFRRPSHGIVQHIWKVFLIFMAIPGWGILLSSFLVGMLKDIPLGGRILGFGASCLLGMAIVGGIGMRIIVAGINSVQSL